MDLNLVEAISTKGIQFNSIKKNINPSGKLNVVIQS